MKRRNEIGLMHHPRDRPRRFSNHSKAGIGGYADVGVAKNEGYGHVDQAASSVVTAHPYRSNASVR